MATAVLGLLSGLSGSGEPGLLGGIDIGSLLNRGHADDSVDDAEERILREDFIPILNEMHPGERLTWPIFWRDAKRVASLPSGNSPLSAARAARLLEYGQAVMDQAEQEFQAAGFPFNFNGGAGGDIPPLWAKMRTALGSISGRTGIGFLGSPTGLLPPLPELLAPGSSVSGSSVSGAVQFLERQVNSVGSGALIIGVGLSLLVAAGAVVWAVNK